MSAPAHPDPLANPPAEQGRYAAWLDATAKLGLLALAAAYLIYVFGLLESHVPLEQLSALWSHPAAAFMEQTGSPKGWEWLALLHKGDILSLLGIAILSGGSLFCLLAVIPLYAHRGETLYIVICGLQIAVLLLAASGFLTGGH
ncbi:MAG: hypothetical protein LBE62_09380 [Azonexus sp.]|jgi:hypothetical protein|nr:hypothetical protein [Azonexus sp.]